MCGLEEPAGVVFINPARVDVIEWWREGRNGAKLGPEEADLARGGLRLGKDRISSQHLAEFLKTYLKMGQNICTGTWRQPGFWSLRWEKTWGASCTGSSHCQAQSWANSPWVGKGSSCQSLGEGEGAAKAWYYPLASLAVAESVRKSSVSWQYLL